VSSWIISVSFLAEDSEWRSRPNVRRIFERKFSGA
jgi:hypothetical protein